MGRVKADDFDFKILVAAYNVVNYSFSSRIFSKCPMDSEPLDLYNHTFVNVDF